MNGDDKIKTCAVLCASVSVDYVTIFDFFFLVYALQWMSDGILMAP